MKKYNVNFETGEGKYTTKGVDFMGIFDKKFYKEFDLEDYIYAEVVVEDEDCDADGMELPEVDDRKYKELKAEITRQLNEAGVPLERVKFLRD